MFSKDRSQAADLGAQSSSDVLGGIGHEVFDAAHDVIEERVAVNEGAEAGDLASDGGSDLGFVVLEELYECGDEIPRNDLLVNSLGDLWETID